MVGEFRIKCFWGIKLALRIKYIKLSIKIKAEVNLKKLYMDSHSKIKQHFNLNSSDIIST